MEDTLNILFPGRPNYAGPTEGWFGFIHHAILFEYSYDIRKRINYIKKNKPKNEIPTRLNHLISLSALSPLLDSLRSKLNALYQEYQFKRDTLHQEYQSKWDALIQEYQPTILNYIKQHIPDCTWDGTQLQFPPAA